MATVDYFLKIDGIDGESTDPNQKGSISIVSWSLGATQGATLLTSGPDPGKASSQVHDIEVTAPISTATTRLFMACVGGEPLKTAELICRKAGKEQLVFYRLIMSDVFVKKVRITGGQGALAPMQDVSLNFGKLEMEYKAQKEDGSVGAPIKGGWDLKKSKKS